MIMPRGQPLLLPVNPVFIVVSLLVGLAINFLPLGRVVWTPDILMLLLAFWVVHQPQRIGMGIAFVLGLCMDVHQSSWLGQHPGLHGAVVWRDGHAPPSAVVQRSVPGIAGVSPVFDGPRGGAFAAHGRWRGFPGILGADRARAGGLALASGQLGAVGAAAPPAGS